MADGSDEEKTEEPTSKKLEDARKEGQVLQSREVNNFATLLGLALLIWMVIPYIFRELMSVLGYFIVNFNDINMSRGALGNLLAQMMEKVGALMSVPIILILFLGLLATIMQSGFLISAKTMEPKLEKLSMIKGLKRIFSMKQMVEFIKGLIKISLIGTIGWIVLLPEIGRMDILPSFSIAQLLNEVFWLILKLLLVILVLMIVIAVADYSYQRYEHLKALRMTRHEVKEEWKQAEGNPEIKIKLAEIRQRRHNQNMATMMKTATVVVTNPTHYAVALYFDFSKIGNRDDDQPNVPMVVAKGQDQAAAIIRNFARKNDIVIYEDPPLARSLYALVEVGQTIPYELFEAVAVVLKYAQKLNAAKARKRKFNEQFN